ncbi:MAG: hypothetical protein JOZ78_13420 [Chroococcidiopsidaceae cyanobacterium CP_BM_ER_R8_30]|nr:hypothetical protein [Chroococcidiopsidaceae cyanobacterium CP_BM_ER_R8_30]
MANLGTRLQWYGTKASLSGCHLCHSESVRQSGSQRYDRYLFYLKWSERTPVTAPA